MRKINLVFNLFGVATLVLLINGLQILNAQQKSDKNIVLSANQSFYKAFQDENINQLDKIWSHDSFVSAIHPISKDVIIGWQGVKESFEEVFKNYTNITIKPVNPQVHIEGNVAWVLENEDFTAKQGDKTIKIESGATNIFVKKAGKWLMVHHQATVAASL
jgi:ketosteroid isomerase-like protein